MSRGRRLWSTLRAALTNFAADEALDHSAVVAFYSLISLGPLAYLGALASARWLRVDRPLERAVETASDMLPAEAGAALAESLRRTGEGPTLVILAVPVLLWVGTSALASLEHGVNAAFGLAGRRSRWRSRLKGLALFAIGWSLLIVLHTGRRWVAFPVPELPDRVDLVLLASLTRLASELLLVSASFVVFSLFYKILPRRRVPWLSAAVGATTALVLWEAARRLFGAWLDHSAAYGVLSGAVASLAALSLWVYTASAIVLLGAEVAAVHCGARPLTKAGISRLDPRQTGDYVPPPDG